MITTNYQVTGMTCQHCANHVTEEVSQLPGVVEVKVDKAGPMSIVSEVEINFEQVKEAVTEAGDYQVAKLA